MRIALDCDGPLYEWDKTARYMLREIRGNTGLEEPSHEWFGPNQTWHNVTNADYDWLWTNGVGLGLFRYGHVVTGAILGVRELAKDHELIVVTSRPRIAIRDTLAWLSYVELPFSGIHILSAGESKATIGADCLVDDYAENVESFTKIGRVGILFDRPWNQSIDEASIGAYRAQGWLGKGGVIDVIRGLQ